MSIILKLSLFLSILIYFKGRQRKSEILLTCQMSLWDECEIHDLFCCNLDYEELEGLMVYISVNLLTSLTLAWL